jgi:IMP dehydrogenase
MKIKKGYDFDDLLLVPKVSTINSREDVDLSVQLGTLKLEVPIIASPMKGIISPELVIEISKLGGIGIMHRFFGRDTHDNYRGVVSAMEVIRDECKNWGISLALNDKWYNMLLEYNPAIICIDVANGNIDSLRKYAHDVKKTIELYHYKTLLMTGNVATYDSARKLADAGVDMVRVGIGNGALCTTRNVTGVGIPQLTALDSCKDVDAIIVCDGGIRNSGDAVKALAMGADILMMGSPFARTYESANNGIIYGQASRKLQEEYYHSVKSVEGFEKEVVKDIALSDLISEYVWGMRSAFTYLNAKNIKELQKNATWVETGTGSIKKL